MLSEEPTGFQAGGGILSHLHLRNIHSLHDQVLNTPCIKSVLFGCPRKHGPHCNKESRLGENSVFWEKLREFVCQEKEENYLHREKFNQKTLGHSISLVHEEIRKQNGS